MGPDFEPVCAFEPCTTEAVGIGQDRAAEDGREGLKPTPSPSGEGADHTTAAVSMEFVSSVRGAWETSRMAGMRSDFEIGRGQKGRSGAELPRVCGGGSAGGIGAKSVGATEGTGGVGKPGVFVEAAQTCGRQCEGTTGHASSGDGTTHVGGSNCERRTGQEAELGGVSGPAWGWRA